MRVRLIDCVGYIVPSSLGYFENEQPRMVRTPWFDEEIPFNMAAEIGTGKVITDHSTIGLVGDDRRLNQRHPPRGVRRGRKNGSSRSWKGCISPFVVLLNARDPGSPAVQQLRAEMEAKIRPAGDGGQLHGAGRGGDHRASCGKSSTSSRCGEMEGLPPPLDPLPRHRPLAEERGLRGGAAGGRTGREAAGRREDGGGPLGVRSGGTGLDRPDGPRGRGRRGYR